MPQKNKIEMLFNPLVKRKQGIEYYGDMNSLPIHISNSIRRYD